MIVAAFDFDRSYIDGVVVFAEGEFDLTHLGHGGGVGDRLGHLFEGELHFFARLEVELVRVVTHALLVAHLGPGLDAE